MNCIVDHETISCGVEVEDWREAVRWAGKLLVEAGCVEECYIDAMIQTKEELGPYIVIAPGIAMPHARPEDGVIKNGISIVTLRTPISFGSHNDPVDVIIAFGAKEAEEHVASLKSLSRFLNNGNKCDALRKAKCPGDILSLFED